MRIKSKSSVLLWPYVWHTTTRAIVHGYNTFEENKREGRTKRLFNVTVVDLENRTKWDLVLSPMGCSVHELEFF